MLIFETQKRPDMTSKVKAILKGKKTKDKKEYTVYVAVTVNGGTPSLISITDKLLPKFWNKKQESIVNHPLATELNAKIIAVKKDVSQIILQHTLKKNVITAASVKAEYQSRDLVNIFEFADNYREVMKKKRSGDTLENVRKHILRLELYQGSRNLNFEDITPDYLNKFEAALFKEELNGNYIQLITRTIRRMFQAAMTLKIIDNYPFGAYEMLEYKPPEKQYPTAKELIEIKKYEPKNAEFDITKKWFVFGCHSGLRISDWHRFSDDPDKFIINGRLYLHPKKKSRGFVSMPICKDLAAAIQDVRETPFSIEEQTFNEKIKLIATDRKINKKFTAHSARHHFAVVQCLEKGISSETGAELMGITLETFVNNYSVVTEEKIDGETLRAWGS